MTEPIRSIEAEKAVLGAVLINQEIFKELDLQAIDFYLVEHQKIWQAFQDLTIEGRTIDILSVNEKINDPLLIQLVADVPSSLHAETYAEIVRDKARRREIVRLASEMAKAAYNQNDNIDKKIPEFMTKLVTEAKTARGAQHISGALSDLYDEVKARYENPSDIWGIPTGLYDYDLLTGGHHAGELTLLMGKPGLGKSILAIQMAVGMANEAPGAVYEMEMGRVQTVRRPVSTEARVKTRNIRSGNLSDGEWDNITAAISAFENLPIYLSDDTSWTTASLRADLSRLKAMHHIKWFVVDYLYLLQDRYGKDDHERLAYISKSLKNICKDLELTGLVIHSMTKSEMDSQTPNLSGIRGSAQIAYDTDIAMFLIEGDSDDKVKLYFSKFREDVPDRYVVLIRDDGFPAFKCLERDLSYRTPYKD